MIYSIEPLRTSPKIPPLNWAEYIAINSPIFLFLFSNYLLYTRMKIAVLFNIGFFINIAINNFLKGILKHKRPAPLIHDTDSANYYGMPSGHAQMMSYMASFMYWSTPTYFLFYFILYVWACMERYINRKHTLAQLFVGAFIGANFATFIWNIWKTYPQINSYSI